MLTVLSVVRVRSFGFSINNKLLDTVKLGLFFIKLLISLPSPNYTKSHLYHLILSDASLQYQCLVQYIAFPSNHLSIYESHRIFLAPPLLQRTSANYLNSDYAQTRVYQIHKPESIWWYHIRHSKMYTFFKTFVTKVESFFRRLNNLFFYSLYFLFRMFKHVSKRVYINSLLQIDIIVYERTF